MFPPGTGSQTYGVGTRDCVLNRKIAFQKESFTNELQPKGLNKHVNLEASSRGSNEIRFNASNTADLKPKALHRQNGDSSLASSKMGVNESLSEPLGIS